MGIWEPLAYWLIGGFEQQTCGYEESEIWGMIRNIMGTESTKRQFGKQVCPEVWVYHSNYRIPQKNQTTLRYAFWKGTVKPWQKRFFVLGGPHYCTGDQLESTASICTCMRRWTSWTAGCLAFFLLSMDRADARPSIPSGKLIQLWKLTIVNTINYKSQYPFTKAILVDHRVYVCWHMSRH